MPTDPLAVRLQADAPHLSPEHAARMVHRLRTAIAEDGAATWHDVAASARKSAARHADQAGRLLALAQLIEDAADSADTGTE